METTKVKRNVFPIGNKGFVHYDDILTVSRYGAKIFAKVGEQQEVEFDFHDAVDASSAMERLWEMYDEEQVVRNETT